MTADFLDPIYVSKPASPNELKEIFRMGEELFDGGVSSINKMKEWHRINPKIFYVIRNTTKPRNAPIEGYFCVVPLKKAAVNALRKGEISGKEFGPEHLTPFMKRANAIYIGAVAGIGFKSRGSALHKLLHHVQDVAENGMDVFTRPVTKHGLRLCKKFDFQCLDGEGVKMNKLHLKSK